jgi:hypothetical protein
LSQRLVRVDVRDDLVDTTLLGPTKLANIHRGVLSIPCSIGTEALHGECWHRACRGSMREVGGNGGGVELHVTPSRAWT